MNRLTNTQLLILLNSEGVFNPDQISFNRIYNDFAGSVISLCTVIEEDIPAYFTLYYTRLELESHLCRLSTKGAKKKCLDTTSPNALHLLMLPCNG